MRYSRQRELVLNQVLARCDHPTAEQIYSALRPQCPGLSLGTVYRNLNGLVEMGRLRRVTIPGQADRFDRTLAEHDHLFCRSCGRVVDVQLERAALDEVCRACPDARIEWYSVNLVGVCADCRAAEQN